jgi:tRNA(Leu) C34 or U34 (ribose-2'-O)-methylase TrmL
MTDQIHAIYQCLRPECRFRFPVSGGQDYITRCPKCGAPIQLVENPYSGLKVEPSTPDDGPIIEGFLDNIRSAFNVGSIFRSADGAGLRHLYLTGITPAPGNSKVSKTALGAEFSVPWTQEWDGTALAQLLCQQGKRLWALEGGEKATSLIEILPDIQDTPIVLVAGSEVSGVDPGILTQCERIIYLPMHGSKQSFNVAVAFGIASYMMRYAQKIANSFGKIL